MTFWQNKNIIRLRIEINEDQWIENEERGMWKYDADGNRKPGRIQKSDPKRHNDCREGYKE